MANKDHSLDDGIIQAAYSEFLAYGFQKASLHIFVILVFEQVNCVRVAVKNLPYRKSAQISVRDALFVTVPYRLHRSA